MGKSAGRHVASRPRSVYSKSRYSKADKLPVKGMICILLIICVFALRFAKDGALFTVRETLASILRTGVDYKETVEVLGQAVSGSQDEATVAAFGKKVLGLDHASVNVNTLPEAEKNVYEDLSPQEGNYTSAGVSSGLFDGKDSGFWWASGGGDLTYPVDTSDKPPVLAFKYTSPVKGKVTSPFGNRIHPISGVPGFHQGVDVGAAQGTQVSAFADGVVSKVEKTNIYGNCVTIKHANGAVTFYGHLKRASVKTGQTVKKGQKIGEVGNTGYSTGPHLHFQLTIDGHLYNPEDYVEF